MPALFPAEISPRSCVTVHAVSSSRLLLLGGTDFSISRGFYSLDVDAAAAQIGHGVYAPARRILLGVIWMASRRYLGEYLSAKASLGP